MSEAERGPEEGVAPGEIEKRPRRSWLRYAPLAVFGILAIVFAIQLGGGGGNSDLDSALLGQTAPEFDLPPVEGLTNGFGEPMPGFDTESLRGQITLVNVWGSWCAPCRQEHPYIMALAADNRFAMFGINHTDQPDSAIRFLADLGNPYDAVGFDPRQRVSIDWGVYGVPETFFVDRNGVIRHKIIGPINEERLAEEVMPMLEELLAETVAIE